MMWWTPVGGNVTNGNNKFYVFSVLWWLCIIYQIPEKVSVIFAWTVEKISLEINSLKVKKKNSSSMFTKKIKRHRFLG